MGRTGAYLRGRQANLEVYSRAHTNLAGTRHTHTHTHTHTPHTESDQSDTATMPYF